jgi:hypothetical protein
VRVARFLLSFTADPSEALCCLHLLLKLGPGLSGPRRDWYGLGALSHSPLFWCTALPGMALPGCTVLTMVTLRAHPPTPTPVGQVRSQALIAGQVCKASQTSDGYDSHLPVYIVPGPVGRA